MLINKTLAGCIKKNNEENKTFMRRRLGICLTSGPLPFLGASNLELGVLKLLFF